MAIKKGFFITGTDTNVGKTRIVIELIKNLKKRGYSTIGLKPLSSGCYQIKKGLRNRDAVRLQTTSSIKLPYEWINPFAFEPRIAPHIAAKKVSEQLTVAKLVEACQPALNLDADFVIIEGAGGFELPLNEHETMADFTKALNFPVILVVGLRLGCLNHALLTRDSMRKHRVRSVGWISHPLKTEMLYQKENIESLKEMLEIPYLGHHPNLLLREILL